MNKKGGVSVSIQLKIYQVINRNDGKKLFVAASNAEDACKLTGWLIGDCFVIEQKPRRGHLKDHDDRLLVKIPCHVCPLQYTECLQPADEECSTRPTAPTLELWIKQAAEAHLCPHVGQSLAKSDHLLHQKWLSVEDAIKELAPKTLTKA